MLVVLWQGSGSCGCSHMPGCMAHMGGIYAKKSYACYADLQMGLDMQASPAAVQGVACAAAFTASACLVVRFFASTRCACVVLVGG
jgi:hypothetical protein